MFKLKTIAMFVILTQTIICGGKTGFNFLTIGVDAKLVSLGDAGVSKPSGIGAIYYNPANLSALKRGAVMFTYRNWMVDGKFFYGSAGLSTKHINLALSLTSLTIPDIEIRHRPGEPEGRFSSRDFSFALTISPNINSRLKFGLTTKYIFEKIFTDEIQSVAFDVGLLYGLNFSNFTLNIGASLKDFGFKESNANVNPPTSLILGASMGHATGENIKVYLSTDVKHRFYEKLNLIVLGIGFEFISVVELNVGYETGNHLKSTVLGIGFNFKNFTINYAFTPFELQFPNSHTFTLEFKL